MTVPGLVHAPYFAGPLSSPPTRTFQFLSVSPVSLTCQVFQEAGAEGGTYWPSGFPPP